MSVGAKLKTATITATLVGAVLTGGYLLRSELIEGTGMVHAAPAPAPQAMPVTVTEIQTEPVRLWTAFSGRLSAIDAPNSVSFSVTNPNVWSVQTTIFDVASTSASARFVDFDPPEASIRFTTPRTRSNW